MTSCPRVSAGRKSQRAAAASQPRADTSPSYRGAAAAGYVSGESRIRRGWKCLRRIAAPPRPRRVYVSGKSRRRRGWICYGESRRRRGFDVHMYAATPRLDMFPANRGVAAAAARIRLRRIAASPRPRRGYVSGESRRRRGWIRPLSQRCGLALDGEGCPPRTKQRNFWDLVTSGVEAFERRRCGVAARRRG